MPERLCLVTVTDEQGQQHALEVTAESTFHAACLFAGTVATGWAVTHTLPRPGPGTVYEVQVVGEPRVYQVSHEAMMRWANDGALQRKLQQARWAAWRKP